MKRTLATLAIALFAISLAGNAVAGTATPRVDRREARQDTRIDQGVRSGALTPGEQARLRAGQAHIDRVEARAKADGMVGPRERRHMERALNHENRAIRRLKHNRRVA
ncbi:MAG: hypothetical protein ACHQ52_09100 [Candidatus Eisenbacteria bacterium]